MATKPFGIYLLQKGVISREQLLAAFAFQERNGPVLKAQALVDRGLLTQEQLNELLPLTAPTTFPELGGLRGVLSSRSRQANTKRFVAELIARGWVSHERINAILDEYQSKLVTTADALVATEAISSDDVKRELAAYERDNAARPALSAPPGIDDHPGGRNGLRLFDSAARLLNDLGFQARPGSVDARRTSLPAADIEVSLEFRGDLAGRFAIRTSRAVLAALIAKLVDGPAPKDDDSQADALREFANVVAGEVCGYLSDEEDLEADISPPSHVFKAPARTSTAFIACTIDLPGELVLSFEPAAHYSSP